MRLARRLVLLEQLWENKRIGMIIFESFPGGKEENRRRANMHAYACLLSFSPRKIPHPLPPSLPLLIFSPPPTPPLLRLMGKEGRRGRRIITVLPSRRTRKRGKGILRCRRRCVSYYPAFALLYCMFQTAFFPFRGKKRL